MNFETYFEIYSSFLEIWMKLKLFNIYISLLEMIFEAEDLLFLTRNRTIAISRFHLDKNISNLSIIHIALKTLKTSTLNRLPPQNDASSLPNPRKQKDKIPFPSLSPKFLFLSPARTIIPLSVPDAQKQRRGTRRSRGVVE